MQIGAAALGSQWSPSRAAGTSGARVNPVGAVSAADGVLVRGEAPQTPPPPATRRAQPAGMLYAMFERMGGASTSVWKGMHVNLVV